VDDFKFNDNAFKMLVLPEMRKELIKSLVESYRSENDFDDFVEGKGRGLIINLHGESVDYYISQCLMSDVPDQDLRASGRHCPQKLSVNVRLFVLFPPELGI
jgi:hypothetical protein